MPLPPGLPFRPSWVLRGRLALGMAPREPAHLLHLEQIGIAAVLSLCAPNEAPAPPAMDTRFLCRRLVLPDHRSGRDPTPVELEAALALLTELWPQGPVYVHCVAGVERSPLVCLAWLMRERQLSLLSALDYLMAVHPITSPLPGQLACLRRLAAGSADQASASGSL